MELSIKLINRECMTKLFEFELENRVFFEKTCPSRGEGYYNMIEFKKILESLIEEQENGLVAMYVIYDQCNEIVGRINLVNIQGEIPDSAELGYRIGEKYQGKGYATQAVSLVLQEAENRYKLYKIEAGTSADNIASQQVLIKSGFQFVEKQEKYILLNQVWHDNLIFEKVLRENG